MRSLIEKMLGLMAKALQLTGRGRRTVPGTLASGRQLSARSAMRQREVLAIPQIHCSFCQRSETQVRKLVAGGGGGYICDACVSIAARIIEDSDSHSRRRVVWQRVRSVLATVLRGRFLTKLRVHATTA
jgi:hypothetical protein